MTQSHSDTRKDVPAVRSVEQVVKQREGLPVGLMYRCNHNDVVENCGVMVGSIMFGL